MITADQGAVASGGDSTSATSGDTGEDNAVGGRSSTGDTEMAGECGADTIVTAATSNAGSADAAAPGCSAADVDGDDGNDDDGDGDSDSDDEDGWEDAGGDGGGEGHSGDAAWEKVGVEDGPSPMFEYDEATMGGMRPPPFSLPRVFVEKDRVQVSWLLSGRQRRPFSVSVPPVVRTRDGGPSCVLGRILF